MDIETIYAFVLIAAGIFGLRSAFRGDSIEASETPKLSEKTSRVIYALTGIILLVFGILRLS